MCLDASPERLAPCPGAAAKHRGSVRRGGPASRRSFGGDFDVKLHARMRRMAKACTAHAGELARQRASSGKWLTPSVMPLVHHRSRVRAKPFPREQAVIMGQGQPSDLWLGGNGHFAAECACQQLPTQAVPQHRDTQRVGLPDQGLGVLQAGALIVGTPFAAQHRQCRIAGDAVRVGLAGLGARCLPDHTLTVQPGAEVTGAVFQGVLQHQHASVAGNTGSTCANDLDECLFIAGNSPPSIGLVAASPCTPNLRFDGFS